MNKENIIFLGIINSAEEFYEITGKNFFELAQQEFNEEPAIYNDKQIIITEEEIKQYFGNYKDIKKLREKAISYFIKNIQGQKFNIGRYKNIRINRRSIEKYKKFSADERKLLIIPKLLNILKMSKYQFYYQIIKREKMK